MPRKITINPTPNPTGLNMAERAFALDIIQSIEDSVTKQRKEEMRARYWRAEWTGDDEKRLRKKIYRAAYNQFTGRQVTEKGCFTLHTGIAVPEEDMDYVLRSLGVS